MAMQFFSEVDWHDPINRDSALNRGLVRCYLAGPAQPRSSRFRDLVGFNHGTLTLMDPVTDWVPSSLGFGALDFDGTDDTVVVPTTGISFASSSSFSMVATVKVAAGEDGYIFANNNGTTDGYGFYFQGSTDRIALTNVNSILTFESSAVFSDTDWVTCGISYNGTTASYYRNGVAAGTATGHSFSASTGTAQFGARNGSTAAAVMFAGQLASFKIFNRALLSSEVSALFADERRGYQQSLNRVRRPLAFDVGGGGGNRRRRVLICGAAA